jgi:hypothetical protein
MSDEKPPFENEARSGTSPPPGGGEPAAPDADERDEALGPMLAVDELDEVTRRRLVQRALDDADAYDDRRAEGRFGRRAAVLGVAAALAIGALVGTVIVTQPDDATTTSAARAPLTTAAGEEAKAAAPDAAAPSPDAAAADAPAAAPEGAPPVALGDLGAVPDPASLRAAINGRLEAGTSSSAASIPCETQNPKGVAGIYGLVAVNAAGTATLHGDSVVVLVGPTPAGASVAVVLDAGRACAFVRNVPL